MKNNRKISRSEEIKKTLQQHELPDKVIDGLKIAIAHGFQKEDLSKTLDGPFKNQLTAALRLENHNPNDLFKLQVFLNSDYDNLFQTSARTYNRTDLLAAANLARPKFPLTENEIKALLQDVNKVVDSGTPASNLVEIFKKHSFANTSTPATLDPFIPEDFEVPENPVIKESPPVAVSSPNYTDSSSDLEDDVFDQEATSDANDNFDQEAIPETDEFFNQESIATPSSNLSDQPIPENPPEPQPQKTAEEETNPQTDYEEENQEEANPTENLVTSSNSPSTSSSLPTNLKPQKTAEEETNPQTDYEEENQEDSSQSDFIDDTDAGENQDNSGFRQHSRHSSKKQKAKKIEKKASKQAKKTGKKAAKRNLTNNIKKVGQKAAKTTRKVTEKAIKVARKAAEAAIKAIRKAIEALAKILPKLIKAAIKGISLLVKATIALVKALVSVFLAGGWVVVAVLAVVGLIVFIIIEVADVFDSSNTIQIGNQAPLKIGEFQNKKSSCLTLEKTALPANIPEGNLSDDKSALFSYSLVLGEGVSQATLTGECSDYVTIACKDGVTNCPKPDPSDLTQEACGALKTALGVDNLTGAIITENITFDLSSYPEVHPYKLPPGTDYLLTNNFQLGADSDCARVDDDITQDQESSSSSRNFELEPGTCVFPIDMIGLNWSAMSWAGQNGFRNNNARRHAGLDINTKGKGKIYAFADGTVVGKQIGFVDHCNTGNSSADAILIQHTLSDGQTIVINYGEINPGSTLKKGDTVKAGDTIGSATVCGMLHLEVYTGDTTRTYRWEDNGLCSKKPAQLLPLSSFIKEFYNNCIFIDNGQPTEEKPPASEKMKNYKDPCP